MEDRKASLAHQLSLVCVVHCSPLLPTCFVLNQDPAQLSDSTTAGVALLLVIAVLRFKQTDYELFL